MSMNDSVWVLCLIAFSVVFVSNAQQEDGQRWLAQNLRRTQESGTCEPQGVIPFIEEEYLVIAYEGTFPLDNETDAIGIDDAFVIAYNDLINCTQPSAFREVFDAEFVTINEETQEFLLRVGAFCNSCSPFEGCGVELFTETNGTVVDLAACSCNGPDMEEFVISMNVYLEVVGIDNLVILDAAQLCPIPECESFDGPTFNETGVCLGVLDPLTFSPSEIPTEAPVEAPSAVNRDAPPEPFSF